MKITDEQLVTAYLKGDERALETLIKRYLKAIYNFAYRYVGKEEAEDVTQEVFLKMWKNLKKFKRNKKFKTWLFTIAKNTCFDFLRKKKKDFALNIEDLDIVPSPGPSLPEKIDKEDLIEKIKKEIEKLPLKMKQVMKLYYDVGLSFKEISEILKEPLNTLKSRHRRAISKLKKLILK